LRLRSDETLNPGAHGSYLEIMPSQRRGRNMVFATP
jgi:hypothetical protein